MSQISIRDFQAEDAVAFRELNEAWIAQYFAIEEADLKPLMDPEGYILNRGGSIFIALLDGKAVGSCALIFTLPGVFEVAKMAVAEEHRGMGIGRRLLEHAIAEARTAGARRLSLETNARLQSAVHLYEAVGFRHLAPERVRPSAYARANVFMEMEL